MAQLRGKGAVALGFPSRDHGEVNVAPDIQGELQFSASEGLLSFHAAKIAHDSLKIKLPVGQYNVTLDAGKAMFAGSLNVMPNQSVALNRNMLSLSKVQSDNTVRGESESGTRYSVLAGLHSGYASVQHSGQLIELKAQHTIAQNKISSFSVGAFLSGRRGYLTTGNSIGTENGYSLGMNASAHLQLASKVRISASPGIGPTLVQQNWHLETSEKTKQASAIGQEAFLDMSLTYEIANIIYGLHLRREALRINDEVTGMHIYYANVAGVSIGF